MLLQENDHMQYLCDTNYWLGSCYLQNSDITANQTTLAFTCTKHI